MHEISPIRGLLPNGGQNPSSTGLQEAMSIMASTQNLARELMEEISEQELPHPCTQEMLLGLAMRMPPYLENLFDAKRKRPKRRANKDAENPADALNKPEKPEH